MSMIEKKRLFMLLMMGSVCTSKYPDAPLEVVSPARYPITYAPAWFGAIVLPPGRYTADVQYAGDACDSLLGRIAVRGKIALVDRGKCSFLHKVLLAHFLDNQSTSSKCTSFLVDVIASGTNRRSCTASKVGPSLSSSSTTATTTSS